MNVAGEMIMKLVRKVFFSLLFLIYVVSILQTSQFLHAC